MAILSWPYQQFKLLILTIFQISYNLIVLLTTNSLLSPPSPPANPNKPVFRQFRQRYIPIDPSPPPSTPLLPPSGKKTLFLDLDQTLISTSKKRLSSGYSSGEQLKFKIDNKTYYVVKRPFAEQLLCSAVASGFEIVIFTAARSNYTSAILKWLDPGAKLISHRIFRDSCTKDKTGNYFKDLDVSGRPVDQSVVIDDILKIYWKHYDNVIPVKPFTGDKNDKELKRLVEFFEFEREFKFQDIRCAVCLFCHFKKLH